MKYLLPFLLLLVPSFALADYSITGSTQSVVEQTFGFASNNSNMTAQGFTTVGAGTIASVVSQTAFGGAASAATISIQADSAGAPSGVDLGSVSITPNASCANSTWTFGTPVSVSATTKYYLVFTRTAGFSTTNYLSNCGENPALTNLVVLRFDTSWATTVSTDNFSLTVVTAAAVTTRSRGIITFFGWW